MTIVGLELNEVDQRVLAGYCSQGLLSNFNTLLRTVGATRTVAKIDYDALQPWVLWPSIYSGIAPQRHDLRHLGEDKALDGPQIWEELERSGARVAAIGPMNARNHCEHALLFLPDFWTTTPVTASANLAALHGALRSMVLENAGGMGGRKGALARIALAAMRSSPRGVAKIAALGSRLRSMPCLRASILDVLLAEVLLKTVKEGNPDYVSLFLNGAAHIQHHHLFSSRGFLAVHPEAADGPPAYHDPVLAAYEVYDWLIGRLLNECPGVRILVTTALTQVPLQDERYEYRIADLGAFMGQFGLSDAAQIDRQMSKDFSVGFSAANRAHEVSGRLQRFSVDSTPVFDTEVREARVRCKIAYTGTPDRLSNVRTDAGAPADLRAHFHGVRVNGVHSPYGFHIDSQQTASSADLPVEQVLDRLRVEGAVGARAPEAAPAIRPKQAVGA